MSDKFFYAPLDPAELKKQREAAKTLRKSNWWQNQLAEGVCYYCEQQFSKDDLTMDHKVPIARGGKSTKSNIVVACKECNSAKQSLTAAEFQADKIQNSND